MTPAPRVWHGIRFADLAHPFAAPVPVVAQPRTVEGGRPGPAPVQRPIDGVDLGADTATDCLFLEVHAPADDGPHPVVLWVYGGGFEIGAATATWLDPAALSAAAGCVVVVANHRLGAYGFGQFSVFGGALADAHDLGLQDVVAALRWVHQNIAAFGGDPTKITLGGQSSGAFLAAAAAVAPDAPWVRAVACFSGGASRVIRDDDAETFARAIAAHPAIGGADRLLTASPDDILTAQVAVAPRDLAVRNGIRPRGFGVACDASSAHPVVPVHPLRRIAEGALRDTFVLAAAAVDEMAGFDPATVPALDGRDLPDAVIELTGAAPAAAIAAEGLDVEAAWHRVLADYIYRLPAVRLVDAQRAAGGGSAYLDVSREDGAPAGHGCEHEAILGRGDGPRAGRIRALLVRLIREGRVDGGGPDDPLLVGDPLPAGVLSPRLLLRAWEGIERP